MGYFTSLKHLFPFSYTLNEENVKEIDDFLVLLDDSHIEKFIQKEEKVGPGRSGYNPYRMMSLVLYSFAVSDGTLRELEKQCEYDFRFQYLSEGEKPSYKTFCEFINRYITPYSELIFGQITSTIISKMNVDIECIYVDGTKIEANANKYKFVWKPYKKTKNLNTRIREKANELNLEIKSDAKGNINSKDLAFAINEYALKNAVFQNQKENKKSHLTPAEKDYIFFYKSLLTLLHYEEIGMICGKDRNSFYKTDHDATAMCLKADYYTGLGSNLHAAYNIQIGVSNGLIIDFLISQERSDVYTFVPLIQRYRDIYGVYPKNICADSGYGCLTNWRFLKENKIGNYVKYINWEGEMTSRRPPLFHIDESNNLVCLQGKKGKIIPIEKGSHTKIKNPTRYRVTGCKNCEIKNYCKRFMKRKFENFRTFDVNLELYNFERESNKNLCSPIGIEYRVNRSIQDEGTFGIIKQDLGYQRIRRRGIDNVDVEFMLVSLGRNLNRYFDFSKNGEKAFIYWKSNVELETEVPKPMKLYVLKRQKNLYKKPK